MKNKIKNIWLFLACVVFFAMLAKAYYISLAIYLFIGLIIAFFVLKRGNTKLLSGNTVETVIEIALDLYIMLRLSSHFYDAWLPRPKLNYFLRTLSENTGLVLRIISILLAAFSFPFIQFISSRVLTSVIGLWKSIEWKKIWTVKAQNNKKLIRTAGVGLGNVIIAALVGLLLLIAAFQLPMDNILSNTRLSAYIMEKEGVYPWLSPYCISQLDNWTDSIMLLEASDETDVPTLEKALMVYRGTIDDKISQEALVEHFLYGKEFDSVNNYARYWHGYLLFLKPLLEFSDYGTVRTINGIVQTALMAVICILMVKRRLTFFIIPYILSYLMLVPAALAKSMQFSPCYYALSLGMIALLLLSEEKRRRYGWLVFLNIGIFVAYYDFLTYPITSFGIPMVLLLALSRKDEVELKLRSMIGNGLAWCAGYGGMWFLKWVLTAIFTDYDIFNEAFNTFLDRTSLNGPQGMKYSVWSCIKLNYIDFFSTPLKFAAALLAVVLLMIIIWKRNRSGETLKIMLPYITVALAPIVWFAFATNHSTIHHWFTFKNCMVSVMSILFGLTEAAIRIKSTTAEKAMQNE